VDTATALFVADLVGVAVVRRVGRVGCGGQTPGRFRGRLRRQLAALGGGILRDIVINQSPPLAFAAALTCAIRVTAMLRGWSAPIAKQP
jgi:uncharacterized membrane protein YeiH